MKYNKTVIPIAIYYAFIYMNNGAYGSYIGLYYASINLSHIQIGWITSLAAVAILLAQPIWGLLSDRAAYKNRIVSFALFVSGITIWLTPLAADNFWLIVLATALYSMFHCAVSPLSDAITLELATAGHFRFSWIRTVGSIGFALMAAVAGRIFQYDIRYIFAAVSLFMLAGFLLSFRIPLVKGHQSKTNRVNLMLLFQNPRITVIYGYCFILACTLGFFFSFHAIYSQQQGIEMQFLGVGVMIGSFSQFPFMIFFDKITARFGIINILLFAGVIHALRWILYAFYLSPVSFIFLWMLHGGTYIMLYLSLAEYIHVHVIPELKASGQMANSLLLVGVSRVIGGALGGTLATQFGLQSVFLLSALVCILAVAGLTLIVRYTQIFLQPRLTQLPTHKA